MNTLAPEIPCPRFFPRPANPLSHIFPSSHKSLGPRFPISSIILLRRSDWIHRTMSCSYNLCLFIKTEKKCTGDNGHITYPAVLFKQWNIHGPNKPGKNNFSVSWLSSKFLSQFFFYKYRLFLKIVFSGRLNQSKWKVFCKTAFPVSNLHF